MIGRFKAAGMLAMIVCVVGAFGAPSASAFFDAKAEHVSISGTQTSNYVFTTALGTMTCKKMTLSGTSLGVSKGDGYYTSADITVHPEMSECTFFGFGATMTTTGCDTTLTRTGTDAEGTPIGPVHWICETGKKIKLVIPGFCTMEFPPQTPSGHVAYHTKNAGTASEDVETAATLEGIKYEGNCGAGTSGKVTGSFTLRAANTAGEVVPFKVT